MGSEFMPAIVRDFNSPNSEYPIVFDGIFGWFSPGVRDRAVVLCGTLGFEQLSAHRAWRELANQIAGVGCAVLRFDYPGEGDSIDIHPECLENYTKAIAQAVMFLRTEAQAGEIILVGLRLGATLAALMAADCRVDGLALLAPFTSGRAYLREMRLRASTIDHLPNGTPIPQKSDELLIGSFRICSSLLADLSKVDLLATVRAPAPKVLILGHDTTQLAKRYNELGCTVTTDLFPELANLLISDMFSETPTEAFKIVTSFVGENLSLAISSCYNPHPASHIRGPDWTEEPRRFGEGMFGVLCRPKHCALDAPIILFISSGRNPHSGRGRQIVTLSRKLAKAGVSSFRFDLLGIGDSAERNDGSSPLYSLKAVDDVFIAVDHLRFLTQNPIIVVGFCSGAFLGFHAICRDKRISTAVLVNLFCFDWNPEHDLETMLRNPHWGVANYAAQARNKASWFRLFRDPKRILTIIEKLMRLAGRICRSRLHALVRKVDFDETIAGRIGKVRRRGSSIALVFSENEPGLSEVYHHLGRTERDIERILGHSIVMLDEADHNLTKIEALGELYRKLIDIIEEEKTKISLQNPIDSREESLRK